MKSNIKQIRTAILKHHGGHEGTDDIGIMRLWDSLGVETQQAYLKEIDSEHKADKKGKEPNDNNDRSTGNV